MTTAAPCPRATGAAATEPGTRIVCTGASGPSSLPGEIEKTRIAASLGVSLTGSRRKSPATTGGAATVPAACPTCKTWRHWPFSSWFMSSTIRFECSAARTIRPCAALTSGGSRTACGNWTEHGESPVAASISNSRSSFVSNSNHLSALTGPATMG